MRSPLDLSFELTIAAVLVGIGALITLPFAAVIVLLRGLPDDDIFPDD